MLSLIVIVSILISSVAANHPRQPYLRRMGAVTVPSVVLPSGAPPSITITPDGVLSGGSAVITVTWVNIDGPTSLDAIAVYCPPDAMDPDMLDYLQNTNATASGSAAFVVVNMRDSIQFRYLDRNGESVVSSNTVSWVPHTPLQVRIALTGKPSEMMVTWTSDADQLTLAPWAQLKGATKRVTAFQTKTYAASDMCADPANRTAAAYFRNPGYFHTALFTGLTPGSQYSYTVGQGNVSSDAFTFTTMPLPGRATKDVRFIMLADHGAVGCWRQKDGCDDAPTTTERITEEIITNNATLVLHVGDISYAVGNGYIWDLHGQEIQKMASIAPYMVSVGNHEYDYTSKWGKDPSGAPPGGWHPTWGNMGGDSGGECGVPTANRFMAPDNGNGVFWYSFDYGPVHVVMMSSEHDYTSGAPQRQWLEKDLAAIDTTRTPWTIVNTHRPLYSSENYAGDWIVGEAMQGALEALFKKSEVDVVLAGHYHAVERTCPVFNQTCCAATEKCPVHIVAGHAGIGLDNAGWFKATWSMFRNEDVHGYLRVSVTEGTMLLEVINAALGTVIDSTTISK